MRIVTVHESRSLAVYVVTCMIMRKTIIRRTKRISEMIVRVFLNFIEKGCLTMSVTVKAKFSRVKRIN